MRSPKALWAVAILVTTLSAAPGSRGQGNYLDVYIAKVRPEKIATAEAIVKKMVDANRRNHGDNVVVLDTLYGELGTYAFISQRADYADIDKGNNAFSLAMAKSFGEQGAQKLESDWYGCLISAHAEIRKRRADLSRKMPADAAAYAKLIGSSRVLRTVVVHVRAGKGAEFESWLKQAKEAGDRNPNTEPMLISQLAEGGTGGTGPVFFLSSLRASLGGFDNNPTLKDVVGDESFAKMQKVLAEVVEGVDTMILHYRPDLSYPPQAIVDVAPEFWAPKPAAPAKPKAQADAAAKPEAKQ
jgi:hypothetical protein